MEIRNPPLPTPCLSRRLGILEIWKSVVCPTQKSKISIQHAHPPNHTYAPLKSKISDSIQYAHPPNHTYAPLKKSKISIQHAHPPNHTYAPLKKVKFLYSTPTPSTTRCGWAYRFSLKNVIGGVRTVYKFYFFELDIQIFLTSHVEFRFALVDSTVRKQRAGCGHVHTSPGRREQ